MIDHKSTSLQLERDATRIINLAKAVGTCGAIREAKSIREDILGLADWHLEQHNKQQAQIQRMRRFKKATNRVFPQLNKNQKTA